MLPRVLYMGQDLYALGYVSSLPEIEDVKGFGRGKLTSSDWSVVVRNSDDQFSVDNPYSFLNGTNWQYNTIQAYDESGIMVFDGIVSNITRDHKSKTAEIQCRDRVFAQRKTPIAYKSSDWETPATAMLNIFTQEGYTAYDNRTLQASIAVLAAGGCYVKVDFKKSESVSLFAAVEKLAQYAAADGYMYRNNVFFQTWQQFTGGVSIYFDYTRADRCPRTAPAVTSLETTFFNDYTIDYEGSGSTPATDSNSNNIGAVSRALYGTQSTPQMRSGSYTSNQISYRDKASAVFIGETLIRRCHTRLATAPKALQQIDFDVDYSFRDYITLGDYFSMTFPEEGWSGKIFECAGIKRSMDGQVLSVTGWEVVV